MGRKSRHEVLGRVKQEVAHGDVCRICSWFSTAKPAFARNPLEAGMAAQQFNRQGHVEADLIGQIEPRAFVVRI